jgi:phosphotriesterase-related protein
MAERAIRTVKGDVPVASLGLILPHEHLFVELRGPSAPNYGAADLDKVAEVVRPHLKVIERIGVTALVDCAPVGVGRNAAVLRHLAELTSIHIVAPTGIYKEGLIPVALLDLSADALAELWIGELTEGMEGTDSRAGFIKVAMSDDGPRPIEVRNLQAAAIASRETGAVVASHTIGGAAARREMDVLEKAGHDLSRFIWVHAHSEPDTAIHVEAARRGAWVEFDAIGAENWHPQDKLLESVAALIEAGYADHILLSHDAGWYDPATSDGNPPNGYRGYTALSEQFIPALKGRGVSEEAIRQMTVVNPARAFSMPTPNPPPHCMERGNLTAR